MFRQTPNRYFEKLLNNCRKCNINELLGKKSCTVKVIVKDFQDKNYKSNLEISLNSLNNLKYMKQIEHATFKTRIKPKIRQINYLTAHKALETKTFINRRTPRESPLCRFCKTHEETIDHIFWECNNIILIKEAVHTLIKLMIKVDIDIEYLKSSVVNVFHHDRINPQYHPSLNIITSIFRQIIWDSLTIKECDPPQMMNKLIDKISKRIENKEVYNTPHLMLNIIR